LAADARSVLLLERALNAGYIVQSQKSEQWFMVALTLEKGKPYVGTGYTFPEALTAALNQVPGNLYIQGNLPDEYGEAAPHVRSVQ
jgi:hypothetical protein